MMKNITRFIKQRKLLTLLLLFIAFFILCATLILPKLNRSLQVISEIQYHDIDLNGLQDGIYTGSVDAGIIYVEVVARMKDGVLTNLQILQHQNLLGSDAEKMIDAMIEYQTSNVDFVSGATMSSKVIRKAVENALLSQ